MRPWLPGLPDQFRRWRREATPLRGRSANRIAARSGPIRSTPTIEPGGQGGRASTSSHMRSPRGIGRTDTVGRPSKSQKQETSSARIRPAIP